MMGAPDHSVWMVCQAEAIRLRANRRRRVIRFTIEGVALLSSCVLMGCVF